MILWAARFLALEVKKGDVVVTLLDAGLDSLALGWAFRASAPPMPQRTPNSGAACSHTRSTTAVPRYSSWRHNTCRSWRPSRPNCKPSSASSFWMLTPVTLRMSRNCLV